MYCLYYYTIAAVFNKCDLLFSTNVICCFQQMYC
nr:MAG TPA: GTPase [Caudoviricetes sp.]